VVWNVSADWKRQTLVNSISSEHYKLTFIGTDPGPLADQHLNLLAEEIRLFIFKQWQQPPRLDIP
jgi:hypothetical protein